MRRTFLMLLFLHQLVSKTRGQPHFIAACSSPNPQCEKKLYKKALEYDITQKILQKFKNSSIYLFYVMLGSHLLC